MDFDFTTNTAVRDLTGVPERFHSFYEPDAAAGGFKLRGDPTVRNAVEAVTGLNQALKASRNEAKNYKDRAVDLSPLTEFGKSPEEIAATIRSKIDELTGQVAAGKNAKLDLDKIKADYSAASAKAIAAKEAKIDKLKKQLETILVDESIRRAIGDQAFDPDLVIPHVRDRVRAVEEDDRVTAVVVDVDGTRRINVASGSPMSINDLVSELKASQKYARLFKSAAPSGGGAPPAGAASKAAPIAGNKTAVDKIASGLSKGLAQRREQFV